MLKSKLMMFLCFAGPSLLLLSATHMRFPVLAAMRTPEIGTKALADKLPASEKPVFTNLCNKQAIKFVHIYIRNNDQDLMAVKERSEAPFGIIDSVFNHYRLPLDLKYVAVVESDLKPSALSRVGAKGPWQLMPRTAHVLGLKVNKHIDERTSYYKSTRAAAKYLRDLHHEFDDWLLVLAAYNGGADQVHKAIRRSHSHNFWALQKFLPHESRLYVKKFIATQYYFETVVKTKNAGKAETNQAAGQHTPVAAAAKIESSDEKFNRLMRESAVSMQKSNELLVSNN